MLWANQEQRASVDRVREEVTLYEAVGGEPYFTALVERFYGGVAADDTGEARVPLRFGTELELVAQGTIFAF